MSTSSNTAARLIEHAPPAAVDLLFARIGNESIRFGIAPSSKLIRERWSTVSADLAISLIGAITDPELLDFIASKEKRKTVRSALAGNSHLHPVTRLYFLQEGLRATDWDLMYTVMGNMPVNDQIEYITEDSRLSRYVRDRSFGSSLVELESDEELVRALTMIDVNRFGLVETLLNKDPERAIRCLTAAGISLHGHRLNSCPEKATDEQIRTLIGNAASIQDFMTVVAASLPLERLVEIDPALLDRLPDTRANLTPGVARFLLAHDKLNVVLEMVRQHRIDEETAQLLAAAVTSVEDRFKIALAHPNDQLAAALVTDPSAFGEASKELSSRDFTRWMMRIAPHIGLENTIELMNGRRGNLDIDGSVFGNLLDTFEISSDQLFAKLPDELLGNISGFRALENPAALLERVTLLPKEAALRIAVGCAAPYPRDLATEILSAKIILAYGEDGHKGHWLESASRAAVEAVLPAYSEMLATLVMRYRRITLQEQWADLLVPLMAPKGGWGGVSGAEMMKVAMVTLSAEIGDDAELWETVLGLFHDWSGTLPDLVAAARAL